MPSRAVPGSVRWSSPPTDPHRRHRLGARRRAHAARRAPVSSTTVASIMSTTVYTCSPGDDTESLMTTMTERRSPRAGRGRRRARSLVSIGDV